MPRNNAEHLPVKYGIDFYHGSFTNESCGHIDTTSPLAQSIHVGDYFSRMSVDNFGAGIDVPHQHVLKVTGVLHNLWKIEGKHIGHSVSVCLQAVPTPADLFP